MNVVDSPIQLEVMTLTPMLDFSCSGGGVLSARGSSHCRLFRKDERLFRKYIYIYIYIRVDDADAAEMRARKSVFSLFFLVFFVSPGTGV